MPIINNTQKNLGYRDVAYNIKRKRFVTTTPGDNYSDLDIEFDGGVGGYEFTGGFSDRLSRSSADIVTQTISRIFQQEKTTMALKVCLVESIYQTESRI